MSLARAMTWPLAICLLLALPPACGGEELTDREVERQAELVGEKAAAVILAYGFGMSGECGDILDKHEDDINEAMKNIEDYDGDSNSKKISLLEDADKKLEKLGEELEDEDCV